MKIKTLMLGASLLGGLGFAVSSCNESPKMEDSKDVAKEQNEEKFDDKDKNKDADFLVWAAEVNLKEIQLGKLAQTRGQSADVKEFGKLLEKEHTQSLKKLNELASRKNISVPTTLTEKGMDAYEKLNKKSDKEFDEAFADLMEDEHKDAIDKYEKKAKEANDEEIRAWASEQLPGLHTHLEHAKNAEEKAENTKKSKN